MIKKVLKMIIFLFILLILSISIFIKFNFSSANFEQLYTAFTKFNGVGIDSIKHGIVFTIIFFLLFIFIFIFLPKSLEILFKRKEYSIKLKNKKYFKIYLPPKLNSKYYITISIISILIIFYNIGIIEFISNKFIKTNIYENYYVNPKEVKYIFPSNKKNLIHIYLESMESSFINTKKGINYIPELEKIAKDNINFSNTNGIGGALSTTNTTWTISGLVAQTAGIPMNMSVEPNSYEDISSFLPGSYTLGEILEDNGYKNYILLGSDASFAGRDEYYKEHGNYTIYDYNYALKYNLIPSNYKVWWGYEDKKLYEIAKNKLIEASSVGNFNFSILTADTHFQDGYLDNSCDKNYEEKYENVLSWSSKMLYEFIEWIKKQSFYENTIIVITGDHLTMQHGKFIKNNLYKERTIYNVFINTDKNTNNYKNRLFSSIDIFPTTLSALNVEFNSNRLGLGTNLFSNKKTLFEELGVDYVNKELYKTSNYYNKNILKSTYYEMIKSNLE